MSVLFSDVSGINLGTLQANFRRKGANINFRQGLVILQSILQYVSQDILPGETEGLVENVKRDSELPWPQGSWPPKECCWGDTAWTNKGRRRCMWGKRMKRRASLSSWSQTGFWAGLEQVLSHPSSPSGRLELPCPLSVEASSQRPASFHQPVYSYLQ